MVALGGITLEVEQGEFLVFTTNKTNHKFIRIDSVDGAKLSGEYAFVEEAKSIVFNLDGKFEDHGTLNILNSQFAYPFKITEQPDVKLPAAEGKVNYQKPKDQKDFDLIQRCVTRGFEEAETAIKYDPNSESAWSYKTNLLIEAAKIAKMNGEADKAAQYEKQANVAQQKATTLADERRKREEAAEAAAASPTP